MNRPGARAATQLYLEADMRRFTLASLFGSDTRPLAWERPFIVAAAFVISRPLMLGLGYSVSYFSAGGFSVSLFGTWSPWTMGHGTADDLLLVALLVVALRALGREWLAILVAALVYGVLAPPVAYPFLPGISGPAVWVQYGLASLLWMLVYFGCLAAALRYIARPGPALVAGAACGGALGLLVPRLVFELMSGSLDLAWYWEFAWRRVPVIFLRGAVAGALMWAGLAIAGSFRAEPARPLIRRPFFVGTDVAANGAALATLAMMLWLVAQWEAGGPGRVASGFGSGTIPPLAEAVVRSLGSRALQLLEIALLGLPALLFGVAGMVVFLRFVYRIWSAIQDGHARTTPGRAVGFLFIPFFNVYWIFQALAGFASDFNALVLRRQLHVAPLSPVLWIVFVVLSLAGIVPVVGIPATLASYVVGTVLIRQACDAINAVAAAAGTATDAAV
jgi:hypothetical protein